MLENDPSAQLDRGDDSPEAPARSGVLVFRRRGWRGVLPLPGDPGSVRVDFDAETISAGRVTIPFAAIRTLELRIGVFGVSDGPRWICFDALRYGDDSGPLIGPDGTPSESFTGFLRDLGRRIPADRQAASDGEEADREAFEFRYRVRVDLGSILLGTFALVVFLVYQSFRYGGGLWKIIDPAGARVFLAGLGIAVAWLYFWRGSSSIRFDAAGIHRRRAWIVRFHPWNEIRGMRHQGLEIELEGNGFRVSFNMDILHGRGAPLLFRRGVRPVVTPLGGRFLEWLRQRTTERPEIPVFGSRSDRRRTRAWVAAIVTANAVLFLLPEPPDVFERNTEGLTRAEQNARDEAYHARLTAFGARTVDAFSEPWRFVTSLFLHADTLHLAINMLVLVSVAPWLGRIFGWFRGSLLYLGSGVLGNVLAQLGLLLISGVPDGNGANPPPISLGSSTAILGVIGSLLGAVYRRPRSVPLAARARFRWAIPVLVLLTLALGLVLPMIDNWAHAGGFVAGFALVWVLPPRRISRGSGVIPALRGS